MVGRYVWVLPLHNQRDGCLFENELPIKLQRRSAECALLILLSCYALVEQSSRVRLIVGIDITSLEYGTVLHG